MVAAAGQADLCPVTGRAVGQFGKPYILIFGLLLAGCSPDASTSQSPKDSGKLLAGVKLHLVVIDDPAIAAEVRGLKDEWFAQTGAEVDVSEATEKTFSSEQGNAGPAMRADALICPEYLLGPMAEAKRLAPVPRGIARAPQGPWSQTFDLLRYQEAVWGDETYGVPLGSPVFCCYCRADVLDKLQRKPPQTWKEYQELARLLYDNAAKFDLKYGTVEPLSNGWAGLLLLARAAAYAKERDNYTTLFDEKTFEPAIAEPPFVRALDELVAVAKLGPAEPLDVDPDAARAEFWKGRTAMALSWPTGARSVRKPDGGPRRAGVTAIVAELPGATEVFQTSSNSWEPRGESATRVPFLGISGRVGVVRAESEHADAAFELLLWLTDAQWGSRVFAASPATTLFRRGQVAAPAAWVESNISAPAAGQYAEETVETLSRRQFLASLRIPARAKYLAALDDAVRDAVKGKQKPADALRTAAQKWREISNQMGVQRQRTAYLHSLGLQ